MFAQTITEFAGFLNDAEYSVSSDKVTQCISAFTDEDADCTNIDDVIGTMRFYFCRSRDEHEQLPDYFQKFITHQEAIQNAGKSKEKINETEREMERHKLAHDKKQDELSGRIRSLESEIEKITERVKQEWKPDPTKFSKTDLSFLEKKKKWIDKLDVPDVEDILSGKNVTVGQSKEAQKTVMEMMENAMKHGKMSEMEDLNKLFSILQKVKQTKKKEAPKKEEAIKEATEETVNKLNSLKEKRKQETLEHAKLQNALTKRIAELRKSMLVIKPEAIKHRTEFRDAKNAVQSFIQCPPEAEKEFKYLSDYDKKIIYKYIHDNILKFKTRMTRNIMDMNTGRIDMGATIKNACRTGGLPMDIFKELHKPGKSNLILILDVSGSCREASEMMLTFMYLLQSVFPRGCQAYAFVNALYDITDIMSMNNVERAIRETLNLVPRGYSNYGKPITSMWENYKVKITKDSFVIMIGDARNNNNRSGEKEFRNIARRAKKIYWMNTDEFNKWGQGDSIAQTYAKYCKMYEIRTPKAIVQFLDQGMR